METNQTNDNMFFKNLQEKLLKKTNNSGAEIIYALCSGFDEQNNSVIPIKFDLHGHTQATDGEFTQIEYYIRAIMNDVNLISFTDHDTIKAYLQIFNTDLNSNFLSQGKQFDKHFFNQLLKNKAINYLQELSMISDETKRKILLDRCNVKDVKNDIKKVINADTYVIPGIEVTCTTNLRNPKTNETSLKKIECLIYDYDIAKLKHLIKEQQAPYLNFNCKRLRNIKNLYNLIDVVNKNNLTDSPIVPEQFFTLINDDSYDRNEFHENQKSFFDLGLKADFVDFSNPNSIKDTITHNGTTYNVNYDYFYRKLFNIMRQSENGTNYIKQNIGDLTDAESDYKKFLRLVMLNQDSLLGSVIEPNSFPTLQEVCMLAKAVEGVSVLAHPFGYNLENEDVNNLVDEASKYCDGIELWHGFNKPSEVKFLWQKVLEKDLMFTCGSDTHGKSNKNNPLIPDLSTGEGPEHTIEIGFAPGKKDSEIKNTPLTTENLYKLMQGTFEKQATTPKEKKSE